MAPKTPLGEHFWTLKGRCKLSRSGSDHEGIWCNFGFLPPVPPSSPSYASVQYNPIRAAGLG